VPDKPAKKRPAAVRFDVLQEPPHQPLLMRRGAVQMIFPPHDGSPRGQEQIGELHF
jgi:hypothetical protein